MKTRRSPRNQEILWHDLGRQMRAAQQEAAAREPLFQPVRCWDCRYYPKGGRSRATCKLHGVMVNGATQDQECFRRP